MKWWNSIKTFFYKRQLNEAVASKKPTRAITNLTDAKSVGIIYDSTNPANDVTVANFAAQLREKGKEVDILAYMSDPKIEQKPGIQLFNKKKLNWVGIPDDEQVNKFAAKNYDLLLACYVTPTPALEYIARTSNAKWRVGPYASDKTEYYDLMVNLGAKTELPYLLEQATHFLNEIKYR